MSIGGRPVQSRQPTADGRRNGIAKRAGLAVVALGIGLAIGLADSSPGWDSTGITAGGLFLSAAAVAWIGRDRPWLWALLVGLPTPILGIVRTGNAGSVLAVGFAAAGAAAGWALRRAR
jgi:hypothetical protein